MIGFPETYLIKALVQPQSMLSLITKTTQGANVLSISPFLVIDGNTLKLYWTRHQSLLKERQDYHESFDKHVVHRLPLQVCKIFIDYGFGLPQAHKRDKQDVLHAAWLYASEQMKGKWVIMHMCMVISCKQVFTSKSPSCTFCKMHILTLRFLGIVPEEINLGKQG